MRVPYTYPSNKHYILPPVQTVDTGSELGNAALADWASVSNFLAVIPNLQSVTRAGISKTVHDMAKAAGFSDADFVAADLYMAVEGQGAMQALSEATQWVKAWGASGLAMKQALALVKAPALGFTSAAPIGGAAGGGGSALQGASPNLKGIVGEARSHIGIEDRGGVVIGNHVSFLGPTGQRTTIDKVYVSNVGRLSGEEAKFGEHAKLTGPQSRVFPQGGRLTLTPVGSRAEEAGLTPGVPVEIDIDILHWLF
jgi:hypothetical protein